MVELDGMPVILLSVADYITPLATNRSAHCCRTRANIVPAVRMGIQHEFQSIEILGQIVKSMPSTPSRMDVWGRLPSQVHSTSMSAN